MLRGHQRLADVEIAAVCDVYAPNLAKAAEVAPTAARHADFRRILDDKSIDAVVIGTPDHWHALMTVLACKAGKDVYVEKPTSVAIDEGRVMVEAARKYKRVVQVGTQQRSQPHFQKAAEIVKSGALGDVTFVRSWNVGNRRRTASATRPTARRPPISTGTCGSARRRRSPFNANRFGVVPDAFSHFRWFWDYAGGMMTDWGVHLIDIVQMGDERGCAARGVGDRRQVPLDRQPRDAGHDRRHLPLPGFRDDLREPRLQRHADQRPLLRHRVPRHRQATLFVDRERYELRPEPKPGTRVQDIVPVAARRP